MCNLATDVPLSVTVRADDGNMKTFEGLTAMDTGTTQNELEVYQVKMGLGDFKYASKLSVFIKDPRHLQVKYGVSGQTEFYGKSGGELGTLTSDADTPLFDFTKYPLLGGDVVGDNGDSQDGVVTG